jgi:hypothetical protein
MSIHNGAPLLARTIRLREQQGNAQLELATGEIVLWTGNGALAIGRQLEASIKAGQIRNILLPLPNGEMHEVHIGPDVNVVHEDGTNESRRS